MMTPFGGISMIIHLLIVVGKKISRKVFLSRQFINGLTTAFSIVIMLGVFTLISSTSYIILKKSLTSESSNLKIFSQIVNTKTLAYDEGINVKKIDCLETSAGLLSHFGELAVLGEKDDTLFLGDLLYDFRVAGFCAGIF